MLMNQSLVPSALSLIGNVAFISLITSSIPVKGMAHTVTSVDVQYTASARVVRKSASIRAAAFGSPLPHCALIGASVRASVLSSGAVAVLCVAIIHSYTAGVMNHIRQGNDSPEIAAGAAHLGLAVLASAVAQWAVSLATLQLCWKKERPVFHVPAGMHHGYVELSSRMLDVATPALLTTCLVHSSSWVDLIAASYIPGALSCA